MNPEKIQDSSWIPEKIILQIQQILNLLSSDQQNYF